MIFSWYGLLLGSPTPTPDCSGAWPLLSGGWLVLGNGWGQTEAGGTTNQFRRDDEESDEPIL
jgi:hypothetical protein